MNAPSGYHGIVDISGSIHTQMWHYPPPYFPPEIFDLPVVDWLPESVYSEAVRMPKQTGTYVETAAHVRPDGVRLDGVPLEQGVLLPAVCVQLPKGPGEAVGAGDLREALTSIGLGAWTGYGLLIATGWDTHWDEPDYLYDCPCVEDDVIAAPLPIRRISASLVRAVWVQGLGA